MGFLDYFKGGKSQAQKDHENFIRNGFALSDGGATYTSREGNKVDNPNATPEQRAALAAANAGAGANVPAPPPPAPVIAPAPTPPPVAAAPTPAPPPPVPTPEDATKVIDAKPRRRNAGILNLIKTSARGVTREPDSLTRMLGAVR